MTTLKNASWWMVWVAMALLLGVQVLDIKQDEIAYQDIKDALSVKPYEVMEKLKEIEAELEKREHLFDELREQGLIGNGGG